MNLIMHQYSIVTKTSGVHKFHLDWITALDKRCAVAEKIRFDREIEFIDEPFAQEGAVD